VSSTKSLVILWLNLITFLVFSVSTVLLTVTRCTFFDVILIFRLSDIFLVYRFINLVLSAKFIVLASTL